MSSTTRTRIMYGKPTDPKYLKSIQQRLKRMSTAKKIKDKCFQVYAMQNLNSHELM